VRLVLLLRDPVALVRSRFVHCLRQAGRQRRPPLPSCGGAVERDYESMLTAGAGLLRLEPGGAAGGSPLRPVAVARDAEALYALRMAPGSIPLVLDYSAVISAWLAAFPPDALLVGFTEEFASGPSSLLNRVLAHAGLQRHDWRASGYPGPDGSLTFHPRKSKSVRERASRRPLLPGFEAATRDALTPVLIRFRTQHPCLRPPWPLGSATSAASGPTDRADTSPLCRARGARTHAAPQ